MVNNINGKIHDLCNKTKIQFINLDQAVLGFHKTRKYYPGDFYFDKDQKIRFRLLNTRFDETKNFNSLAYQIMAKKFSWVIEEFGKQPLQVASISNKHDDKPPENTPKIHALELNIKMPKKFKTTPLPLTDTQLTIEKLNERLSPDNPNMDTIPKEQKSTEPPVVQFFQNSSSFSEQMFLILLDL